MKGVRRYSKPNGIRKKHCAIADLVVHWSTPPTEELSTNYTSCDHTCQVEVFMCVSKLFWVGVKCVCNVWVLWEKLWGIQIGGVPLFFQIEREP